MEKLKRLFVSSRPISWVNTFFPFAAAYLATGGKLDTYVVIAALYLLIPYNVLIYVANDVFDYESDIRNPRKNSIEGGLLPPELHRYMLIATAILNVPFLIYLTMYGTTLSNSVLWLLVFMALAYSVPVLRFKERPGIDSITSSFHFVSPMVFGLVLTGWRPTYWPYVIAFFLWGCASHAFGAVQDIVADRQAKIHSIATQFGAATTTRLSFALYGGCAMLLALQGWPAVIIGLIAALYAGVVFPYWNLRDKDAQEANTGWRRFLVLNQLAGFAVTIVLLVEALW